MSEFYGLYISTHGAAWVDELTADEMMKALTKMGSDDASYGNYVAIGRSQERLTELAKVIDKRTRIKCEADAQDDANGMNNYLAEQASEREESEFVDLPTDARELIRISTPSPAAGIAHFEPSGWWFTPPGYRSAAIYCGERKAAEMSLWAQSGQEAKFDEFIEQDIRYEVHGLRGGRAVFKSWDEAILEAGQILQIAKSRAVSE